MKTLLTITTIGLLATSTAFGQCSSSKSHARNMGTTVKAMTVSATAPQDIVETALAAGQFNTLAKALTAADLVSALQGDGPFTVFAPTDAAFAKLPKHTLASLLKPENKDQLTAILTYHVVAGRVPSTEAVKLSNARTLNGQQIDLQVNRGKLQIDGATVVKADINCSNGVIHVIDSVILPSSDDIIATATKAGSFKTLAAAIGAAGLVETLQGPGPFTVFAPTDEAFAKLPKGTVESLLKPENRDQLVSILTYHVASGRQFASDVLRAGTVETLQKNPVRVRIETGAALANNARLLTTDIDASNGVIHVIDTVLMPPAAETTRSTPAQSLIEMAINRGAPLFNHGQPEACAAVYEIAAAGLMSMDNISSHDRQRLQRALMDASRTNDHRQRAWIMRDALDAVYEAM